MHNGSRNNSCYFIAWDFKLLYYTKRKDKFLHMCCKKRSLWRIISKKLHTAHNERRNNSCYFIAWDFKLLYYTKKRKVACDLKSESNAKVAVTWLKFCIPRITRTEITLVILLRGTSSPTQLHEKRKVACDLKFPVKYKFFCEKGTSKFEIEIQIIWFSGHAVPNIVRCIALSGTYLLHLNVFGEFWDAF